jgi:predicted alpha/beta hydrolase family esterase
METKQQILLIHGGTTYESHDKYLNALKSKTPKLEWIQSRRDWKNELQDQLGEDFVVYLPQMPNKQNSQYEEWKILFEKIFELLDENPILIGYSLGAIFLVKYLSENKVNKKIKKTFLLGTPFDNEGLEKEPLYTFLRNGDLHNLEERAGELYFYHSEDDFAVPFSHLSKYQESLPNARFRALNDRRHFIVESIPELNIDIVE